MPRHSLPWIVLGLILAALAAWWVGGERAGAPRDGLDGRSDGSADSASEVGLRGADGARPPRPGDLTADAPESASTPAAPELLGVVVDPDGEPIAGALVYLLPKEAGDDAGDVARPPPNTTSAGDGGWSLGQRELAGRWLGAVAEGCLPVHFDGDAPPVDGIFRVVLEPGPEIGVHIQGVNGGPLEFDTSILVEPRAEAVAWPGPEDEWAFQQEAEIPAGSQALRVRVPTRRDVIVSAHHHHYWWFVEPDEAVVAPPVIELVFTISRSCVLEFRVLDAESGAPLPRGFMYTRFEDGTLVSGGSTSLPGGRMRVTTGVRPGVYTFVIRATGYRPEQSSSVTLTTPGEEGTVEVALEPDPSRGTLRVSLPALAELPRRVGPGGEEQAPPAFFLWRRPLALAPEFERAFAKPGDWGGLDCEVLRESETDYLFEGVPAGEVGLLVGESVSGRVAYVPRIVLRGAQVDTTTVDLQHGIRAGVGGLLPVKGSCRSFRVRHPVHGVLPTWGFGLASSYRLPPGEVPERGQQIGPYPGPEIEVEVTAEDGVVSKHTLRAPDR